MPASAFQQDDVVPLVFDVAVAFPVANLAKAAFAVQCPAGVIIGDHLRLQGPVSVGLRHSDQPFQKSGSDSLALCIGADIDADLSDTGGASARRGRGESGEARRQPFRIYFTDGHPVIS